MNTTLPIAFDGFGQLEVDPLCEDTRVAAKLDGAQHLGDSVAYRRDRGKDHLLQENGYLVLRFLAEDLGTELDAVKNTTLRALSLGHPRREVALRNDGWARIERAGFRDRERVVRC